MRLFIFMRLVILILVSMLMMACNVTPKEYAQADSLLSSIPEKTAATEKILIGIPPIVKPHVDSGVYADINNRIDLAIVNLQSIKKAAASATKTVEKAAAQDDPLISKIRVWSFLGIGVGTLLVGASFIFARYVDLTIARDVGILFFVSGIFGAVLAIFMKTLITILFVLLIAAALTGIVIFVCKMIKYKRAGISIVESVDELFDKGLIQKSKSIIDTLNTIQTPDARALVDIAQSK